MLFAALQGLAEAVGVRHIAGVGAARLISNRNQISTDFRCSYDNFFAAVGAKENQQGFFCSSLPLSDKPLDAIRPDHRSRTLKKRKFKRLIAEAVSANLKEGYIDSYHEDYSPSSLNWLNASSKANISN